MGFRPYNTVRLSVIADHAIPSPYFTYTKDFEYKWPVNSNNKPNYLNTGIVTVTPGKTNTFVVENTVINITLPAANAGVRGVILSDPCSLGVLQVRLNYLIIFVLCPHHHYSIGIRICSTRSQNGLVF
jgi:hypothetical protein